jgi:hypothetical protein
LPEEMSFFCIGHNKISTQKFRSVTDIVFTDITHHVIGLYPNTYPDCLVQCKSKSIANAWILPQHAIEYLKIKTQDKIYTQSRFI